MTSAKIIVLTTLYKPKGSKVGPMLETTSYKTDPRGEEYFAEFKKHEVFDCVSTFVNRLVYYSGEGKFVPLINSRVLYDITHEKTVYAGTLTLHPASRDYKNPYKRDSDTEEIVRRISVSMIETVNGPVNSRFNFNADETDLKELFQCDPIKLERRPKMVNKDGRKDKTDIKSGRSDVDPKERKEEKKRHYEGETSKKE